MRINIMTTTQQVTTFLGVQKQKPINNTPILNWLNLIKKSGYSYYIESARNNPKDSKKYIELKKAIPVATFNFNFKDWKKETNITNPTGFLYIDIDNQEFDINILDKNKIYSYYHSFGGKGYSIIVQVDGLTPNNFKSTFYNICEQLGILSYIDKQAIKSTQSNILSYDPNIFINTNSYIFTAINDNNEKCTPSLTNSKQKKEYSSTGGTKLEYHKLIFSSIELIDIGENLSYTNWDGIKHFKCYIPKKKLKNGRHNFLLAYTNNLVILNSTASFERIKQTIISVSKVSCIEQPPIEDIIKIIKSVFKYKEEGTLKPIWFKKDRKIILNKNLNKEEKMQQVVIEMKKMYADKSCQKINDIITDWDFKLYGKISIRKISDNYPISKKTVAKYWSEFKEFVQELNNKNI